MRCYLPEEGGTPYPTPATRFPAQNYRRESCPDGGGVTPGPISSFASTTESSVAGRPPQSLFDPSDPGSPAGAFGSIGVEHASSDFSIP